MSLTQPSPGILTLTSSTTFADLDIALNIPAQTLRLKSFRVQMASAADSIVSKVLYIELPFVSRNQVLDNNVGHVFLPIPLDESRVTLETSIDLPIFMTENLPERFTMRVLDGPGSAFAEATNFEHITLQFELARGHLH